MKSQVHCLARIVLLVVFALIIIGCGSQLAFATSTPGTFTGSFSMFGQGCGASEANQSIPGGLDLYPGPFFGNFSFVGVVASYFNDQGCHPQTPGCLEHWNGTLSGGSVSFWAVDTSMNPFSFSGSISGGTFSGLGSCDYPILTCGYDNNLTFVFTSLWSNNWYSVGMVSVNSGKAIDGPEMESLGTLTMTTTATPEPSALAWLGAGVVAAAKLVRRRFWF